MNNKFKFHWTNRYL